MQPTPRTLLTVVTVVLALGSAAPIAAIQITLDYTLDANNHNWFGIETPAGAARRDAVDAAAGFLSTIITNDDWNPLGSLNESFSISDIGASSITNIAGNTINGSPDTDGTGFAYTLETTNRSSVAANEYVVYVGAFPFDSGTSAHAKGGWDSNDRRNAAGVAQTEFNTWGGRIYFDSDNSWFTGLNPGFDPTDDYGIQDPNKTPPSDISSDNWDWSTSDQAWKGFDLESVDPAADGLLDLYAVAVHELIHALGATSSNMVTYVGVDGNDNLVGQNVVAVAGGPVPRDGGHFSEDQQSVVWSSGDIVSEATLDPNTLRSNRKYLTELDAALLRDLGYVVASGFTPEFAAGDYNNDGTINAADYTAWRDALGTLTTLPGDATPGAVTPLDYRFWRQNFGTASGQVVAVPEPPGIWLLVVSFAAATSAGPRKARWNVQ